MIEKFKSEEYWTLTADAEKDGQAFNARLFEYDGGKVEQFSFRDEKSARGAEKTLLKSANGKLEITHVEKKKRKRNPAAPFTTSTLQQEASRKLGFGASRTMQVAQRLYEGIELDGDTVGLITYMRTDGVAIAAEAIAAARQLIGRELGGRYLPAIGE